MATVRHRPILAAGLALLVGCLVPSTPAVAQSVVVEQIEVRGKAVTSAGLLRLVAPGADEAELLTLQVGRRIEAGTDIATPAEVAVVLLSEAGNRLRLAPNSRVRLAQGPASRTVIDLVSGSIGLAIRDALDFFGVRHQRIVASVKGTEFTVGEASRGRVEVSVREGHVVIERPGAATIGGSDREPELDVVGLQSASDLTAGQSSGFDALAPVQATRFAGRLEAEAYFQRQWDSARAGASPSAQWRALDNLLTVLQALGRSGQVLALTGDCERVAGGRVPPDAMARCQNHRGAARFARGEVTRAAADFEAAASRLAQRPTIGDTVFAALVQTNLAVAWRRLGRLNEALHWHERSLAILRPLFGDRADPGLANALDAHGNALLAAGRFEAAGRELAAGLAMRRQLYPDGAHPSIAASLGNLAALKLATGQPEQALRLTQDSLAIWQARYPGHDSADIAIGLVRLGDIHERAARLPEARLALRRALAMIERLGDEASAGLRAAALLGLARVASASGDTDEAQRWAGRAVDLLQASATADASVSPEWRVALDTRASIAYRSGRFERAAADYRALGAALQREADDSPAAIARRANVLNNLGLAERGQGRSALAVQAHERALALRRSLQGAYGEWAVAQSEANLGRALIDAGQLARARRHLLAALAIHRRDPAEQRAAEHSAVLASLALLEEKSGSLDEALRASEQALALQRRLRGGADHPAIAHGLAIRGRLLAAQGQVQAAWAVQQQALAMMARVHPELGHPEWADALAEASRTLEAMGDTARAGRLAEQGAAMRRRLSSR